MIKIYGTKTCTDCTAVHQQADGNPQYEFIDVGEHVRHLKAFLRLRDTSPVFDQAKREGYIGIPCFVLEDGTVTLSAEEAGLRSDLADGPSCNIDGTGC